MLRAPALMRIRNIREEGRNAGKNLRRKLSRRSDGHHNEICNKDLKFTLSDAVYKPALSCCSRFRVDDETNSELHVNFHFTQGKLGKQKEGRVYYKDDQQRFTHRYTLKLSAMADYNITVTVEPATPLNYFKIGGTTFEKFLTKETCTEESTLAVHALIWSTRNFETTEDKYRMVLPCVIKFEGHKEMKFEIMSKFFDRGDERIYCDSPLSFLVLNPVEEGECKGKKEKLYEVHFH